METISKPCVHSFNVAMKWNMKAEYGTMTSGKRMPVLFAPPVEFGGTDSVWSPEQLLASAVASCYMTTFLHFAKLMKIKISDFHIDVKMEIEKKDKLGFKATKYLVHPEISFETHQELQTISDLLSKAKRYCIISNSVNGDISVEPIIKNN
jgi:organic hydroperoxide reductase OsmC/OhrA